MAETKCSDDSLFTTAKENYTRLRHYCMLLEDGGYWENPSKIMKQTSFDVLDLYVQSILVKLALTCDRLHKEQREFIIHIPQRNALGFTGDTKMDAQAYKTAERFYELPPVLLQLLGVYDKENPGDSAKYFLDAILNIMLCMASLENGRTERVNDFIKDYYEKISVFLNKEEDGVQVIRRYVYYKLSKPEISCEVKWLKAQEKKLRKKKLKKARQVAMGKKNLREPWDRKISDTETETAGSVAETMDLETDNASITEVQELDTGNATITETPETEMDYADIAEAPKIETDHADIAEAPEMETNHADMAEAPKMESSNVAIAEAPKVEEPVPAEESDEELENRAREQFQLVKKRLRERELQAEREKQERINTVLGELQELVGLEGVKTEINSLVNLIKVSKMRKIMNLPGIEMSYHMVFTGNPGTGKTTVARLVAKIYKELGILSKGELVETDRAGLVAGYVGQTAIRVKEVVESALGGVLFIDEAYSLVNSGVPNDFGTEAIDTLVKLMEDNRNDLVVIVAGYTEEMKEFLKGNTGLISRFNKFIGFSDYTDEELLEILNSMAEKTGLHFVPEALEEVKKRLAAMDEEERQRFGNARGIRNMFEKIVMNQANRIVLEEETTEELLSTILLEDI